MVPIIDNIGRPGIQRLNAGMCRPLLFVDQIKSVVTVGDLQRVESQAVIVVHRIDHIRMLGRTQEQHAEMPRYPMVGVQCTPIDTALGHVQNFLLDITA